jgi:hypothetical protein
MARPILFHAQGLPGKTLCGKPAVRIAAPGGFVSCTVCARAVRERRAEAAPLRSDVTRMLAAGRRASERS